MGVIKELGYIGINSWSLWFGVSVMVPAGFTLFFMQWKTAMKAFSGLKDIFSKKNVIPAASGIIAGESLAGVFIILAMTLMGK